MRAGTQNKDCPNELFRFGNEIRWRTEPFPMYKVFTTFKHPHSTNPGNTKLNNSVEGFPQTCSSNCSLRPLSTVRPANWVTALSNAPQLLDSIADSSCVSVVGRPNPMVIRWKCVEIMLETMSVRLGPGYSIQFWTSVTSLSASHSPKEMSHSP